MKTRSIFHAALLFLLAHSPASPAELRTLVPMLREGGYVIVFRHGASDDSQKDVYPLNFGDMTAQRQLSEKGRETARQIGAAIKQLRIPIGEVDTSRLNRAIETGKLVSDQEVHALDALTDSGAGSAAAMANPTGGNAKAGLALRELVNAAPKAGTNTVIVTHKTNIADAFGKEASDVQEGEAFVYKPHGPAGPAELIGRVKAADWPSQIVN
jgi:phosphohistidine phosphatase SixA